MKLPAPILCSIALAVSAASASGCASGARRIGSVRPDDPRWPRDGNKHIAYVGELQSPENLGIEHGFFARAWRLLAGAGESEALYRPYAVAIAKDGRIAVADPGRRAVHLYDPKAGDYRRIGTGLAYPVAVAFAGETLIVADADKHLLHAYGREAEPVPLPVKVPALQRPGGLAVDEARKVLYVTDSAAHAVHALPFGGGEGRVLSGRGGDEGQFNFPTHVAVDGEGRLYVCDAMNFRVQIFDSSLRFQRTFGRLGDGMGDLPRPKGLAVDREGHVIVVEGYFDVIQVFDGQGTLLGVFGGTGIAAGRFYLPGGAASDGRYLYVADTFNARVQVFDLEQGAAP
jgi:DNA-binding beta-propeller fold protein YncE